MVRFSISTKRAKELIALFVFGVAYSSLSVLIDDPQHPSTSSLRVEGEARNAFSTRFLQEQDKTVEVDDHKRAIAMISFGESAAESTLLERAILSIRRRGAFDGHVVVITDAPEERYEGVFDDNVIVLSSKEDDLKFGYFESEGMKYKRFKTLVLNYIEEVPELDDVEWVYYMDIDMLMGAPFDQLVKNLDEEYGIEGTAVDDEDNHTTSTVYMFKDPNSVKFAMNSGFIGMSRKNSKHCLDLWREEMDIYPDYGFDQMSLNHVVEKQECRVVGMDREGHLQYTMNENSLVKMMKEATFPNLIHLYNSVKAEKFSEETTDEFVYNVLILSEEEKESHKYGKAVIKPSRDKWTVSLEAKLEE